ncbi:MAG: large conductance mechanosensitive channel protein MscL [Saccharofermentans sp.]|jgi:large conductance mechanosensitive channel|nr:large conductance mechanosensitive channel protein MscL [Saccharofermentans sp.]
MGFMKEFKEFALKGNVMDMAVGVIIGGAFGGIVGALTDDFINPLINSIGGAQIGGSFVLPWSKLADSTDPEVLATISIKYGHFVTQIINFLILALVLFIIIKGMNKLTTLGKKKEEEAPAAPPEPSDEVKLLTEIKDILKEKN